MKEFTQKYLILIFVGLFFVIAIIAFSDSPFEKVNKFEYDRYKQSENFSEQEVVILEIADKTPVRVDSLNLINISYILKIKSVNPLFDGKTIAVSKEDYYNKYEIGKSYPFTIETQTTVTKGLKP